MNYRQKSTYLRMRTVEYRHVINPRRSEYLVCVVCVFALICRLTHWNHKSEVPTDLSQYGNDLKKEIFVKTFRSKVMA